MRGGRRSSPFLLGRSLARERNPGSHAHSCRNKSSSGPSECSTCLPLPWGARIVRALTITEPGYAEIRSVPKPPNVDRSLLLKVQMVGLCGSDLNSFRGKNPLVSLPRVPGHEVSATIVEGSKHYPLLVEGLSGSDAVRGVLLQRVAEIR